MQLDGAQQVKASDTCNTHACLINKKIRGDLGESLDKDKKIKAQEIKPATFFHFTFPVFVREQRATHAADEE